MSSDNLFGDLPLTVQETEWQNMPECVSQDLTSFRKIQVHFSCQEDVDRFAALIEKHISKKTSWIWFSDREVRSFMNKRYVDES